MEKKDKTGTAKEKTFKKRKKVMECACCHKMTLRLVRKIWEKRPYKDYQELRGYYECRCGNKCYKVFATEPVLK